MTATFRANDQNSNTYARRVNTTVTNADGTNTLVITALVTTVLRVRVSRIIISSSERPLARA